MTTQRRDLKSAMAASHDMSPSTANESHLDLLDVGETVSCGSRAGRQKFVNDAWRMEW